MFFGGTEDIMRDPMHERWPNRRDFLASGAAAVTGLSLGEAIAQGVQLPATPECSEEPTVRQTEGPFYKPRTPERVDLREPGAAGKTIALTGFVLARDCKPIAQAIVDLWHADERGDYDERGFRYRGHVFTDSEGRFRFLTVTPALYTGRTRHFHVKVQAPGKRLLTTQLYFPDEPGNARDPIFRRELTMKMVETGERMSGRFDFVVA
jgi:protocatechuate 3,4-dioxygenase beta subunit